MSSSFHFQTGQSTKKNVNLQSWTNKTFAYSWYPYSHAYHGWGRVLLSFLFFLRSLWKSNFTEIKIKLAVSNIPFQRRLKCSPPHFFGDFLLIIIIIIIKSGRDSLKKTMPDKVSTTATEPPTKMTSLSRTDQTSRNERKCRSQIAHVCSEGIAAIKLTKQLCVCVLF